MKKLLMTDEQAKEFAGLIINEIKPYISSNKEKYEEFLKKYFTPWKGEKFENGKI